MSEVVEKLKLKALTNRIIVKPLEEKHQEKVGSIYLPDERSTRKLCKGEVVSVGSRFTELGVKIPSDVTAGDVIVYSEKLVHTDSWLGDYIILNQEVPMAIVEE